MPTEAGALIVALRMDAAEFRATAGQVQKDITEVGKAGHTSSSAFSHLASTLTKELIPGLDVSIREMNLLIKTASTAAGVLGTIATVIAAIGAAIAGYALGNYIRNFVELVQQGYSLRDAFDLARGATTRWEQEMKKANEEQDKFIEQMQRTRAAILQADKALSDAQGRRDIARAKAQGAGGEGDVAFQEYKAALAQIENQKKISAAQIAADKLSAETRATLLVKLDQTTNTQREAALLEYRARYVKVSEDITAAQFKIWQDETQFLIGEFQKRVRAREQFEMQLGKGGLGGTTVEGLGEVGDFQRQVAKSARDLAGLLRTGTITQSQYWDTLRQIQVRAFEDADKLRWKWAEFPAVADAVTKVVRDMSTGFDQLDDQMRDATTWAKQYLDTNQELEKRQGALAEQFQKVPSATAQAGQAVQKLATDYNELAWQAAGATQQIYNAAAAMVYFHSVGG